MSDANLVLPPHESARTNWSSTISFILHYEVQCNCMSPLLKLSRDTRKKMLTVQAKHQVSHSFLLKVLIFIGFCCVHADVCHRTYQNFQVGKNVILILLRRKTLFSFGALSIHFCLPWFYGNCALAPNRDLGAHYSSFGFCFLQYSPCIAKFS